MTEVQKSMALFSGSVNPELAEEIAKDLNVSLGNVKLEKFANGEIYARYQESVRGADVFLVQSVCSGAGYDVNDALMELLIMVDAAKRASARSVSAVVAHYGYARQDRKAAPREPITAKLVADLMAASGVDNVITIDLHQDAIQGFFDLPVNHMTAMPIFVDYFQSMGLDKDKLCVVSPDVGRAKAAKKFSTMLDCDIAIMHKVCEAQPGRDHGAHRQRARQGVHPERRHDRHGQLALVAAATTLKAKGRRERCTRARRTACSAACGVRAHRELVHRVVVTNACPCRWSARPAR